MLYLYIMVTKTPKFFYILSFMKSLYWEIKSYFVVEKVVYKIEGKCKRCGKCCNYMYSYDTYTEKEFKFMQFLFPKYKRFYIKGRDDLGNLIFACKYVTKDGLCSQYDKRLEMCKRYPVKILKFKPILHEGCGFKVVEKDFLSYLR